MARCWQARDNCSLLSSGSIGTATPPPPTCTGRIISPIAPWSCTTTTYLRGRLVLRAQLFLAGVVAPGLEGRKRKTPASGRPGLLCENHRGKGTAPLRRPDRAFYVLDKPYEHHFRLIAPVRNPCPIRAAILL